MSFLSDIFAGGLSGIISPITNTITAIFTKKEDVTLEKYKVDGKVDITVLQEDTKRLQAQASLYQTMFAYKGFRLIIYGFYLPVLAWFAAYMWDSGFRNLVPTGWTWIVLTPEPAIMTFIQWMFGFLFLHAISTAFRK